MTMRNFTDNEIIRRVETHAKGFTGWRPGVYSIWIRSKADRYDEFDDKNFIYYVDREGSTPRFVMKRDGTTNAGSYGLKRFFEYNSLGCAVLKADHMIYGSHVFGLHKGKPAYRQAKPWPYHRDNDKDNKAEEIGPVYNDIIYANDHRSGWFSRWIKNWSTACLVTAVLKQYLAFLDFMKGLGYPPLNTAILKEF